MRLFLMMDSRGIVALVLLAGLSTVATSKFSVSITPRNANAAMSVCAEQGFIVAKIENELEAAELDDAAHDAGVDTYWVSTIVRGDNGFGWDRGSQLKFTNWEARHNDTALSSTVCVQVRNAIWFVTNCKKLAPVACMQKNTKSVQKSVLHNWAQQRRSNQPFEITKARERRHPHYPSVAPTNYHPCMSQPCQNNGTCYPVSDVAPVNGLDEEESGLEDDFSGASGDDVDYICRCLDRFYGRDCEFYITDSPSLKPTATPTGVPSSIPTTTEPTQEPSGLPTRIPSPSPSESPSAVPTSLPTQIPSPSPSESPSAAPSTLPSASPTSTPTPLPTLPPTSEPSAAPTITPSSYPSVSPSVSPTLVPTSLPTKYPTLVPTSEPSEFPSATPTKSPTISSPSESPTLSHPCDHEPCLNGGICMRGDPTNDVSGLDPEESGDDADTSQLFSCECTRWFEGELCELELTPSPTAFPSNKPTTSSPTSGPSTTEPTSFPTSFPTIAPSLSPTVSCEGLFQSAIEDFSQAQIAFEPGSGSGDSIVVANSGPTKARARVAFVSLVWGPNEPKIALKFTNPSLGDRSFIVSGTVNITRDNSCENGQFLPMSEHPGSASTGSSSAEIRTLRYGVGVADVEATIGSWAPKIPGYKLEVFLLSDAWNSRSPPQAMAYIEDIELQHNQTFISFNAYVDGQDPNSQRLLPFSEDLSLTINASWGWHQSDEGDFRLIASIKNKDCPSSQCVSGVTNASGDTSFSNLVSLLDPGSAVFTFHIDSSIPISAIATHEVQLYLERCENSNCIRIAESNRWSFKVYASGANEGDLLAFDGSATASNASPGTLSISVLLAIVASLALLLSVGASVYYRRKKRSSQISSVSNETFVVDVDQECDQSSPRVAWGVLHDSKEGLPKLHFENRKTLIAFDQL